jgi:hypothetical protein
MAKRNSISGAWTARPVEMLESEAYRVLSLSAHRALSRIEVELAHHGGQDNGKLPVTFADFESYGIRRQSIGPALDELEALGFIKVTERGKSAKAAEYRRHNKFLLMSRPKQKGVEAPREWLQFQTPEEALAAVAEAHARRERLKAAGCETSPEAGTETSPKQPNRRLRNATTIEGRNGTTIYISGRDPVRQENGAGHAPTPIADAPTLAPTLPSHSPADRPTGPNPRPVAPASTIAA